MSQEEGHKENMYVTRGRSTRRTCVSQEKGHKKAMCVIRRTQVLPEGEHKGKPCKSQQRDKEIKENEHLCLNTLTQRLKKKKLPTIL